MIRIAVDGPGGAGKSTIARRVAKELGIEYIDTGAMYRAIGLKLIKTDTDMNDEKALVGMLEETSIDFSNGFTVSAPRKRYANLYKFNTKLLTASLLTSSCGISIAEYSSSPIFDNFS